MDISARIVGFNDTIFNYVVIVVDSLIFYFFYVSSAYNSTFLIGKMYRCSVEVMNEHAELCQWVKNL